jgi:3-methyladenine DNA glycosylase/8-oxoguanine DNA glycosylase
VTGIIPCLWADTDVAPIDRGNVLRELAARDRVLGAIIQRIGPFGLLPHDSADAFHSLARSIVYQQLSGKAAGTIFGRFRALFPGEAFPAPERVLEMRHARLRRAGLSEAKAKAMRDLAAHAARGDIPSITDLRRMPPEEVIERLTVVRGVGRWTVEMLLIFRLGHPDVLPAHDLGIRKGLARIMRRRELPEPEDVLRRGERWRPYRSVASWYLWRATELPQARSRSRSP